MLIGSSGGACCCVILEHAALNRMLEADVLDTSLCVETGGAGGCVRVISECVFRLSTRI